MSKRHTYINPKDVVGRGGYVGTPAQEAAKWLRDAAIDYLKGRSLAKSVDEAIQNWSEVTHTPASPVR